MRKTLLTLAALGALAGSTGCLTSEGQRFGRDVLGDVMVRKIAPEGDQNTVNVYNGDSGQGNSDDGIRYIIDENLLDGTEKDKQEAKAVYRAMIYADSINIYSRADIERRRKIDLSGCSKGFRDAYEGVLIAWEERFNADVKTRRKIGLSRINAAWDVLNAEAFKEGVRKR